MFFILKLGSNAGELHNLELADATYCRRNRLMGLKVSLLLLQHLNSSHIVHESKPGLYFRDHTSNVE